MRQHVGDALTLTDQNRRAVSQAPSLVASFEVEIERGNEQLRSLRHNCDISLRRQSADELCRSNAVAFAVSRELVEKLREHHLTGKDGTSPEGFRDRQCSLMQSVIRSKERDPITGVGEDFPHSDSSRSPYR